MTPPGSPNSQLNDPTARAPSCGYSLKCVSRRCRSGTLDNLEICLAEGLRLSKFYHAIKKPDRRIACRRPEQQDRRSPAAKISSHDRRGDRRDALVAPSIGDKAGTPDPTTIASKSPNTAASISSLRPERLSHDLARRPPHGDPVAHSDRVAFGSGQTVDPEPNRRPGRRARNSFTVPMRALVVDRYERCRRPGVLQGRR